MNNNPYIYIIFIRALTGLGRFARLFSDYPYTHIAVSLDSRMEDFVTFSRRTHYNPFDAGFMHEKREHYAFGKNEKVQVKIVRIPVSDEAFRDVLKYVDEIEKDDEYIFNLYSMATMSMIHGIPIHKALNCMSFTARVLELSQGVVLDRPYYKYDISELDSLTSCYPSRTGYLVKHKDDADYMKKAGLGKLIRSFISINVNLLRRL